MRNLFILICAFFIAPVALGASKEKSAEVAKCIARVAGGKQTAFTADQLKTIIEGDLGESTLPTTLRREYVRESKTLVTLSVYVKRSSSYTGRRLVISVEGLPKEKRSEFISLFFSDLQSLDRNSQISAHTPDPDNVVRGTFEVADYLIATDYRHPLTAEEGAKLFALVDLILNNRLRDIEVKDSITTPALNKPDVQF